VRTVLVIDIERLVGAEAHHLAPPTGRRRIPPANGVDTTPFATAALAAIFASVGTRSVASASPRLSLIFLVCHLMSLCKNSVRIILRPKLLFPLPQGKGGLGSVPSSCSTESALPLETCVSLYSSLQRPQRPENPQLPSCAKDLFCRQAESQSSQLRVQLLSRSAAIDDKRITCVPAGVPSELGADDQPTSSSIRLRPPPPSARASSVVLPLFSSGSIPIFS